VRTITFSPNNKLIASALYDRTIRFWDTATGAALYTLKGQFGTGRVIAFSPNSKLVASVGSSEVQLWAAKTGAALHKFIGNRAIRDFIKTIDDSKLVASGSYDWLWDAATRERPFR
jgi:WD40 repeat protein